AGCATGGIGVRVCGAQTWRDGKPGGPGGVSARRETRGFIQIARAYPADRRVTAQSGGQGAQAQSARADSVSGRHHNTKNLIVCNTAAPSMPGPVADAKVTPRR